MGLGPGPRFVGSSGLIYVLLMMMALLIHNCVLNYVLGPYAGSMTTSQLPTLCDWPRGIVLSCAWCLALLRAQNASADECMSVSGA